MLKVPKYGAIGVVKVWAEERRPAKKADWNGAKNKQIERKRHGNGLCEKNTFLMSPVCFCASVTFFDP